MQFAPPAMVEPLPSVFGALFNDSNIELRCRVECSPECSVEWYRSHPDKGNYNLMFDPLYNIEVGYLVVCLVSLGVQRKEFVKISF